MRYSQLFGKTNKMKPADADSTNARLLLQGGFVNQLAAGIYTLMPLGVRVVEKIKKIVRQEMDAVGGNETLMPALIPKALWDATGRWDKIDVMFKLEGAGNKHYALGPTHEEVVTPLAQTYVKSYKELPIAVYQIQTKFRNEPRPKSGLLRGREFMMKDMYSFHLTEKDFSRYYQEVTQAYLRVFKRMGLDAIVTEASGGVFTKKNSHEFQVPTPFGEDLIYMCGKCRFAQNKEITTLKDGDACPACEGTVQEIKAIEVGNIFPLETRFSDAINFTVTDQSGKPAKVIMGCYGIGITRAFGSIVEVFHDDRGIRWPKSVAPFQVHLISLSSKNAQAQERVAEAASSLYEELVGEGFEVLWDDRAEVSAGVKFADADLIGIPLRLVVSEKTLAEGAAEWKERSEEQGRLVKLTDIKEVLHAFYETSAD